MVGVGVVGLVEDRQCGNSGLCKQQDELTTAELSDDSTLNPKLLTDC